MRIKLLLLPGILSVLLIGACSDGSDGDPTQVFYDIEVFPTGDSSTDVQNLSGAFAGGGTIYLRAQTESGVKQAFELGDEVIQIENSVVIVGEIGGDQWTGEGMTRLMGGRLESHIPGTEIEIRGIHFIDSLNGAIDFRAGHNLSFIGNRVTADTMQGQGIHDVVILPLQTIAVNIGGELYDDPLGHSHSYADVTGTIRVEDNYANTEEAGIPLTWPADKRPTPNSHQEAWSYLPTVENVTSWLQWRDVAWYTRHFQVVGSAGDIIIRGNKSFDSPGDGVTVINAHGTVDISNNEITLSEATAYYISAPAVGILYTDSDVAGEHDSEERVTIEANRIITNGIFQYGIATFDHLASAREFNVFNNDITLSPTEEENPSSFGIYAWHINFLLADNEVNGVGTGGAWLGWDVGGHASNNVFSGLESSLGDFVINDEVIPESKHKDLDLNSF